MAYNYAAYTNSYGQYAAQAPAMNAQQQTSAAGGFTYGQNAATAYGVSTPSTTASTPSVGAHGYGSTPTATTTAAAASAYTYPYNYNAYNAGSSTYNAATVASNPIQGYQQSWYGASSVASTATTQQAGTTVQTANVQQQAYSQYLQQYQQQMNAYQQYANNANAAATPVAAVAAKPAVTPQPQQQKPAWGAYNQMGQQPQQRNQVMDNTKRNDAMKSGWGNYQQQNMGNQQSNNNQQKTTGVVYRTPMKYSADTQQFTGSNMNQNYNTNQSFKSPNSNNTQSSYSAPNQNYGGGNQSYGNNQSFGGNNIQRQQQHQPQQQSQPPQHQQQYGRGNQNNTQNFGQNQNFHQQKNQNMGGGNFNTPNRGGFGSSGGMNMQGGGQQHGAIRPLMPPPQRPPMGGNNNSGGGPGGFTGNMGGPRDRPSIPPFPRAWHGQDQSGPGHRGGFGDQKERWNGPGGRNSGGFNQSPQQQNRMYNNNSRNPKGSNRELWSPAQKSGPKQTPEKDVKISPMKKEEVEKIDKDKHPEIKTYLYAWLGARHTRPIYDIRQTGERPNIMFRCDLRVDKYSFVGVGNASSKKEAQTMAAWKFADYLVRINEIKESELPSKISPLMPSEEEGDIGDVHEQKNVPPPVQNKGRKDGDDFRNRSRRGQRGGGPNRGRGGRRGGGNQPNWGGPPPTPEISAEIQPLMAIPVAPWGSPPPMGPPMGPPPPRMMGPPPPAALMDFGPPFWDEGWARPPLGLGMGPPPPMGPPMHIRPPPPFMRRNQNDFWRRRDIEERMMDLSRGGGDWVHPEDMFISQMIRNQQEGERRQRGQRNSSSMDTGSSGEWDRTPQPPRPIITSDDRHVMAKHAEIYPQEGELKNLHRIVNTVEQALKLLSDKFVDEDHPKEPTKKSEDDEKNAEDDSESIEKKEQNEESDAKQEVTDKSVENKEDSSEQKDEKKEEKRAKIKILKRPKKTAKQVDTRPRVLCGVNRVGPLSKGLLITKDTCVQLVLLCGEIPTKALLERIMKFIREKLVEVDAELKLTVEQKEEEAGFVVKSLDEKSPVEIMVVLTAMTLRKPPPKKVEEKAKTVEKEETEDEEKTESKDDNQETKENSASKDEVKTEDPPTEPDPVGILPKSKMLDALACLRHTHWFQAKACVLQSCVILTRILRDLQRRDELWGKISEWALEVLIHNCLTSSEEQMSPGDACRRFFEVIAGGILLPDMPGINDPCERYPQRDILDCLTMQEREKLTMSGQRFLRNLAFREIHLILGMEKLPSNKNDNHNPKTGSKNHDKKADDEKVGESNNQRKRRFESNGNDGVAESPKRSLTDEEDTDTQQNMAELSISDEKTEAKATSEEIPAASDDHLTSSKDGDISMDVAESVPELTQEEEDALLEEDDTMDT